MLDRFKTGFRAAAALVMLAALWVAAACGAAASATGEPIPADVSMVGRVDLATILADDSLADIYAALPADAERPSDLEAALAMVTEKIGVDVTRVSEVLFFGTGPDQDELGLIITGDLDLDGLLAAIAKAEGSQPVVSDALGTKVHSFTSDGKGKLNGETFSVAALADGRLAAGGSDAVRRVIEVAAGQGQAVSGDLMSRLDALGSPWVKMVVDVSADDTAKLLGDEGPAGAVTSFLPIDLTAFADVRTVSLVLDKRAGEFVMEADVGFASADSATRSGNVIDGLVSLAKGFVPDVDAVAFLDGLEVSTTDASVSIDFTIGADEVVQVVRDLSSLIPDLGP